MSSTKINVAVAGVTSGLGHAIASALAANPSVKLTLLTRATSSSSIPEVLQPLVDTGAVVRAVNYASVASITEALQGVYTVISTVFTPGDMTSADNLLKAAKAAGVKRFAPSEFSASKEANDVELFRLTKNLHWNDVEASGMEYTAFRNGMFMDYFATGSPSYHGPLKIFPFVINVMEGTAELPGTGDDKVTFTALADIGKFVSAAVTLDKWPEELGMTGETLSYNEVVKKAEEVTGKKFKVSYLSVEDLERRREESGAKNDIGGKFHAEVLLKLTEGQGEIKNPLLNYRTTVQPINVTEFLQKYWGRQ